MVLFCRSDIISLHKNTGIADIMNRVYVSTGGIKHKMKTTI